MASPTGQAGTAKYSKQLVIAATPDMRARIDAEAATHSLSISEVARTYIELGMQAADGLVEV